MGARRDADARDELREDAAQRPHVVLVVVPPRTGFLRRGVRQRACNSWFHPSKSVYRVVLSKSIPAQIRQLILHVSNRKGSVDEFVGELTSAKRLKKHFVREKVCGLRSVVCGFWFRVCAFGLRVEG